MPIHGLVTLRCIAQSIWVQFGHLKSERHVVGDCRWKDEGISMRRMRVALDRGVNGGGEHILRNVETLFDCEQPNIGANPLTHFE